MPRLRSEDRSAVDAQVGARLRLRRALLGMSQEMLGEAIGVSYQQIQKYERGANRVSGGMLHKLSGVLGVPVSSFFEDLPPTRDASAATASEAATVTRRETLELVRAYYRIPDARRHTLLALVKSIARAMPTPEQAEAAVTSGVHQSG